MTKTFGALFAALLVSGQMLRADEGPQGVEGLVCYWDFHEAAGEERISVGEADYRLEEVGGPIERTEGGPFGEFSVRLKSGQYFRIPRGGFPKIDFHGAEARFTLVAWVKRERDSRWQTVAGVWNESRKQRQYCLFIDGSTRADSRTMTRKPCDNLVHGHVSDVGGPSPGEKFCITYSTSPVPVVVGKWQMVAMTYDGEESRAVVDGRFVKDEGRNPFPAQGPMFHGDADFTVGAVDRSNEMGNFFAGSLGGLAIYSRMLSAEELAGLPKPR